MAKCVACNLSETKDKVVIDYLDKMNQCGVRNAYLVRVALYKLCMEHPDSIPSISISDMEKLLGNTTETVTTTTKKDKPKKHEHEQRQEPNQEEPQEVATKELQPQNEEVEIEEVKKVKEVVDIEKELETKEEAITEEQEYKKDEQKQEVKREKSMSQIDKIKSYTEKPTSAQDKQAQFMARSGLKKNISKPKPKK